MALNQNDRSIASFTMAAHALVHWFEAAIPIFLVVWLAEFDVSVVLVGLIVALGYAPFGLGALPGGILVDQYGTKRLILCCLLGMSSSFVVLAGATLVDSIYAIVAGLVLWGVSASIYHPAGLALISTGVEDRGTVFAWHGIAGNAGIAAGPLVAATLLIALEWYLVAVALAIPGFLVLLYGLQARFDPVAAVDDIDADDGKLRSLSDLLSSSRALFGTAFAIVFVIVIFEGLYYRGMLTYLPEILNGVPAIEDLEIAPALEAYDIDPEFYIYVVLLAVGMAGQYVGGKLIDRVSPARGLASLFVILTALALAYIPVIGRGIGPIVVLCGIFGFFLFAIQPFYQNAVAVYTPAENRGLSYGYTYLGEHGLGAMSVALGGFFLGVSTSSFFVLIGVFSITGAVLSLALLFGLDRLYTAITPAPDDTDV